ncbi:uncharacterized protein LOC108601458 [Drosophila busckii]|uniref:uncharacterized protein LOC108601458 n=1 Tax=Drosophila busckii TaxID=30019 RepID=UPI00083EDEFC|nr:uncharacterized protein LOC108601458 [Drosophila busckii]
MQAQANGLDARFNLAASAPQQQPQRQAQPLEVNLNAWQPFAGHNNWLILQATAATSVQRKQEQAQRLPVNYYAYNHRYSAGDAAGNYQQLQSNPGESDQRSYLLAMGRAAGALRLATEANMRAKPETRDSDNIGTATPNADKKVMSGASLLAPFEHALGQVRSFCDTLRSLISLDSVPDEHSLSSDSDENTLAATATATENISEEVQGRYSRLALTAESRKLKKLKKKIQKLFFPLLIAYKLKFLTLIPVLIGGLTLLVGTTGLAGFFFALFTAVMSLKTSTGGGHGSKAIVLKKL